MDLPTAIEKYWAHLVAVATAAGWALNKWLDAGSKRRADAVASAAARQVVKLDLAKLVREETADIIQRLREEVDHWVAEVEKLRQEIHDIQHSNALTVAQKDAEIALLRGRNRQLEATIAAHRRQMLAGGLELPAEPAFFELNDGELKPMGETQ